MAKILYFAILVDRLGRASEETALPASVTDVRTLLAWLRRRGDNWNRALADNAVRVTINRQIVALDSPVDDNAEIAIVSMRPD
ncbi:MAG TPA: MoaD/ThiS family protein [Candidatus Methylomirabilis sp.]|nr:MoaD/ThiS family protein [Candidatus Methylomirabilis sp.]